MGANFAGGVFPGGSTERYDNNRRLHLQFTGPYVTTCQHILWNLHPGRLITLRTLQVCLPCCKDNAPLCGTVSYRRWV